MFFGPGGRRDFRDTLKRRVCQSWEDAGEVVAHRDFESAAAFNDGEDCCDARPGLFAADMDPVGSAQGDGRIEFSARLVLSSSSGWSRKRASRVQIESV